MRVLVVDDNSDMAHILGELIARAHYEVRVAATGHEAIDVAREWHPDLALVDIRLPDTEGYHLGAELRALPGLAHLRLVAITGEEANAERLNHLRFDDFLRKPFSFETLKTVLIDADQPG